MPKNKLIQYEQPVLTPEMRAAGAEALSVWHQYNSLFESEEDAITEIWTAIWKHCEESKA